MAKSGMIVTGATGFIGRHLLEDLKHDYNVWALSRGSPSIRGISLPASVRWIPVDIAIKGDLERVFSEIGRAGGAEILIHLAGHYDFTGMRDPEYERTNVVGMRNVLDAARALGVRDVIFSSSVAACGFPAPGEAITEAFPPDGDTPYAESKRSGEKMLQEYRGDFRCWIIRFAALFSDWAEYEPLFRFLESWLSRQPRSRIVAGCGRSAIPFLHVRDAVDFVHELLARRDALDPARVLLASPDGATSHLELFEAATAAHYGKRMNAILMPRPLCRAALEIREMLGRLGGFHAFERPWMGRMIDLELRVDSRESRRRLRWEPRARLGIIRRMPFLIQNRKTLPADWQRRNHAALKGVRRHENLRIHRMLEDHRPQLVERIVDYLLDPVRAHRFPRLQESERSAHVADNTMLIHALVDSVRTGDKAIFQSCCRDFARQRRGEGFDLEELASAVDALNDLCVLYLAEAEAGPAWNLALFDHITMTVQFGIDEMHEVFEEPSR